MSGPRIIELGDLMRMRIDRAVFQRPVDPEHVRGIMTYVRHTISRGRVPVLNSIVVARLTTNSEAKTMIIDGQHRLDALQRLQTEGCVLPNIPCLEYAFSSIEDVRAAFIDLNTVYTVAEVYLEIEPEPQRDLYSEIESYVSGLEKRMRGVPWKPFSPTRINRPHGRLTEFMDVLCSTVLPQFRTLKDFQDFECRVNSELRDRCSNPTFLKKNKITDKMLITWTAYDYFLTCELGYSWMADFVMH
jgi:hypothetical protein